MATSHMRSVPPGGGRAAGPEGGAPAAPGVTTAGRPDPGVEGAPPRRVDPGVLAVIGLGGALGAPARYGVAQLVPAGAGAFPWATLWTNVSGSFALGFTVVFVLERLSASRYLRPFLATGFLGAYTTYSAFAVETDLLAKGGRIPLALAYAATSLVGGLGAVWAGILTARAVSARLRGGRR